MKERVRVRETDTDRQGGRKTGNRLSISSKQYIEIKKNTMFFLTITVTHRMCVSIHAKPNIQRSLIAQTEKVTHSNNLLSFTIYLLIYAV